MESPEDEAVVAEDGVLMKKPRSHRRREGLGGVRPGSGERGGHGGESEPDREVERGVHAGDVASVERRDILLLLRLLLPGRRCGWPSPAWAGVGPGEHLPLGADEPDGRRLDEGTPKIECQK